MNHIYMTEDGEYLMMSQAPSHTSQVRFYYSKDINQATVFRPGKLPNNFPKNLIKLEAIELRQVRLVPNV